MFEAFRNSAVKTKDLKTGIKLGYNIKKIDSLLQEIIDRCEEHNSGHAECDLRYEVEDSIRRFLLSGGKYNE